MNPSETDRIEGWKGVADYLKCDVTTAMRWARERGLPVHRHPGDKRSRVYAFRAELDAWLTSGPRTEVSVLDAERDSHEAKGAQPLPAETEEGAEPAVPQRAPRTWLTAAVAIVALTALTGAVYHRIIGGRLASVRIEGDSLVAVDSRDRVLWAHSFGERPSIAPHLTFDDRHWVGDVDGDGWVEVLVVITRSAAGRPVEDTLYCFDHRGREKWSFTLKDTFRFRSTDFGPPWFAGGVAVYESGGARRIALTQAHNTWWPGVLLTLNARGERLSTFVSSGVLYYLRPSRTPDGRPLLVTGGVSNSRSAGSLMVLDGNEPSGVTPEEPGSPFECVDCPKGQPLRYFSFPTSEIALAAGLPYNHLAGLDRVGDSFEARVLEMGPATAPELANAALTVFRFGPDFQLRDARWSDSFKPTHDFYARRGTLKHRAEDCPNRDPVVQELVPGRGLVTLVAEGRGSTRMSATAAAGSASR